MSSTSESATLSLAEAKEFLSSTASLHSEAVERKKLQTEAIQKLETKINELEAELQQSQETGDEAVRDVKLVAARMIKDREDAILNLKRQILSMQTAASSQSSSHLVQQKTTG